MVGVDGKMCIVVSVVNSFNMPKGRKVGVV